MSILSKALRRAKRGVQRATTIPRGVRGTFVGKLANMAKKAVMKPENILMAATTAANFVVPGSGFIIGAVGGATRNISDIKSRVRATARELMPPKPVVLPQVAAINPAPAPEGQITWDDLNDEEKAMLMYLLEQQGG